MNSWVMLGVPDRLPSRLLLFVMIFLPDLAALEVDVLSDQARANSLAYQGRVITRILLRDEYTIL